MRKRWPAIEPRDSAWQADDRCAKATTMSDQNHHIRDAELKLDILLGFSDVVLTALKQGLAPEAISLIALDVATDVLETAQIGDAAARRIWLANELRNRNLVSDG
jgi:hypothetical protein